MPLSESRGGLDLPAGDAYRVSVSISRPHAFRAVLLGDDGVPANTLTLPSDVDVPPNRIRVPSDFAGASAFDVYELVDDRSWPDEATFQLVSTVPRSTDDLPEHERDLLQSGDLDSDDERA
jgi:hypothetical protein